MLKLPHLLLVQELHFAGLVDPSLPLVDELLEPSGHVLVLQSFLLRHHQLLLQPLSLVDGVGHRFIPHLLLESVVLQLGLGPTALAADLEQLVAGAVARCTVHEVKHKMDSDEEMGLTADELAAVEHFLDHWIHLYQ